MLRSMTGFGSARSRIESEEIAVEIRSVNSKFCEVKVRTPRELQALESDAVRIVKGRLARGAIDVSLRRGTAAGPTLAPRIDEELAARIAESFRALQQRLGLAGEVSIGDLIAVQGVVTLEEREIDLDHASAALKAALDEALGVLIAMREREGEALRVDLSQRIDAVESFAARLSQEAPLAVRQQQERILQRIAELTGGIDLDPQRIAQEVALLAERSDIAEELTRLDSHVAQLRELLGADEPVGRRLDFLVQELNREANTVASKSNWSGSAAITVELKAEIERIREQIQNVE